MERKNTVPESGMSTCKISGEEVSKPAQGVTEEVNDWNTVVKWSTSLQFREPGISALDYCIDFVHGCWQFPGDRCSCNEVKQWSLSQTWVKIVEVGLVLE